MPSGSSGVVRVVRVVRGRQSRQSRQGSSESSGVVRGRQGRQESSGVVRVVRSRQSRQGSSESSGVVSYESSESSGVVTQNSTTIETITVSFFQLGVYFRLPFPLERFQVDESRFSTSERVCWSDLPAQWRFFFPAIKKYNILNVRVALFPHVRSFKVDAD